MKEVTKHCYRIKCMELCPVENRNTWLEWRKRHRTVPTTSTLCSYFGHGFESLNHSLHERAGLREDKPAKTGYSAIFKERAMEHGNNMEPLAKKAFKRFLKKYEEHEMQGYPCHYKCIFSGEISRRTRIRYAEETVQVIHTPDDVYLFDDISSSGHMIVEYKCPYKVVIERGDKSIATVAMDFKLGNAFGKEAAFIQAATYCLLYKAALFYTVFYFTDTVGEEFIVVYKYSATEELYEAIFTALKDTAYYLEEIVKCEAAGGGRSYRSPTKARGKLSGLMYTSWIESFIYDVKADILNK